MVVRLRMAATLFWAMENMIVVSKKKEDISNESNS